MHISDGMFICDAGYISDGVYMGRTPCPHVRRCRYSGRPNPSGRRKLFGSPQAPYLRWRVFGRKPKPRGVYGEHPMPQDRRCRYSGRPNPSGRRKLFGSPQAPYLRWRVFGRKPKPRGVYGENPMPPRQTLPLFGEPNPAERRKLFGSPQAPYLRCHVFGSARTPIVHFSLFIIHFPSHDSKYQLGRHGVL